LIILKIAETFGVKIDTQLITGKPAEEIIRFAKQGDLIIMAHHDHTKGFDKVIEKCISRGCSKSALFCFYSKIKRKKFIFLVFLSSSFLTL